MINKKVFLLAMFLFVVIILLFNQFQYNSNIDKIEYRTDIEPIKKRFSELTNIKSVFWKADTIGRPSIGPTDLWFKGFIVLEDNSIRTEYIWELKELNFEKGMSPEITGFDNSEWYFSKEFSDKIKTNQYMGEMYYDLNNNIVYFDLSTY